LPANHRAKLPVMAKANKEDEVKRSGQQDDGALNLRNVPNMVASPEVEQIGPNWGISAYNGEHLSLLLRTQHLKEPTKGTDVEEMIADGHRGTYYMYLGSRNES
jgi:hypothetical protein